MNKKVAVVVFCIAMCRAYARPVYDESCELSTKEEVFLSSPWPVIEGRFDVLVLQPSGSNLSYAAEAFPTPLPSPHWDIFNIHPGHHFGFDLGLKAVFHSLHTDLMLNWEHFRSSSCAIQEVDENDMIGPFFEIGPDAAPYKKAQGTVDFHFDEVTLDYGQLVSFGERLQTNLFAGISIMRIHQNLTSSFSSIDDTTMRTIAVPSSFIGAGPQFGVDFSYCIINHVHFVGEVTGSLLAGSLKNHTCYSALSPFLSVVDVPAPNNQNTSVQHSSQVVPAFKQKLGISYVFNWRDCYMMRFDVGYQAQLYMNVIQSVDISSEVVTPPIIPDTVGVFARTFHKNISNFALTGAYVTFTIGF
jgi:Legionella pneumophila major outer membrane protein precursor